MKNKTKKIKNLYCCVEEVENVRLKSDWDLKRLEIKNNKVK